MHTITTTHEALIPGAEAARAFGYTGDYVAKLARDGKIVGKRIGKAWHVSKASLTAFKEQTEREKRERSEKLREERRAELSAHTPPGAEVVAEKPQSVRSPFVIPKHAAVHPTRRALIQTVAVVVFGLVTGAASYGVLEHDVPLEKQFRMALRTLLPEDVSLPSVPAVATETLNRIETPLAQVVAPVGEPQSSEGPDTRVVIAPGTVLTEERVQMIRDSLSDEVTILPDPDHPDSGIIIPHFKDAQGEPYRFLTLPVDMGSSES